MGEGVQAREREAGAIGYGPLCAEFYDLDKPSAPADALAYYLERARRCGGAILEPMCGSGRYLLPLLAAGVDIEGVDAAPAMLAACRRHAARQGLHPVLHEQTFESLALSRRYALAFVPAGSVGLLEDHALATGLERLRSHCERGATLLLELIDPSAADEGDAELASRHVQVDAQTTITYACRAERAEQGRALRFVGCYTKRRGDAVLAVEDETLKLWLREPAAVGRLLTEAGFERIEIIPAAYPGLVGSGCVLVEAHGPR